MPLMQTRRRFLATLSLASAAGLLRAPPSLAAEGALDTTRIRIAKVGAICLAPQYVSEELLRAEGFTDIGYVELSDPAAIGQAIGRGEADFSTAFAIDPIQAIDAGAPITIVSGVHAGCYELFAQPGIRGIADLKGKKVGLSATPELIQMMAAYVGLDPTKDIHWVINPAVKPTDLYEKGQIDAFLGFPPEPQDLRARHVGHAVVNSAVDRPWSQYFCCMLAANRDYVGKNRIATKHVLRAILKAADLCVSNPQRVARQLVDSGFTDRYDYALQALGELPYDKWHEYDPEDTLRFYALRLHEAGMIKSTPQKIIADGTDWRFLDEVKRELKA